MAAAPHPAFTRSLRNQIGTTAPIMGRITYTGQFTSSDGRTAERCPAPEPRCGISSLMTGVTSDRPVCGATPRITHRPARMIMGTRMVVVTPCTRRRPAGAGSSRIVRRMRM